MKSLSNSQPGCFGGFTFASLLRRERRLSPSTSSASGQNVGANPEPNVTVETLDTALKRRQHLLCGAGEEWILNADGPPSYSSPPDYFINDAKTLRLLDADIVNTIETTLDKISPQLRDLSLKLQARPELAFEEKYAHDIMCNFMEEQGFTVTRHYAGLDTAWRAEYTVGTGGRVLGVNSEMDALPGIGHACGHNLIAICGLGIAVGVKEALVAHSVPGKVVLLGTPAEEGGGGKIILLKKDAYKEMDACLMAHPSPGAENSSSNGVTSGAQFIFVEYMGRTAHAAAAPWEGKNALDAAVIAYSAVSALRQQLKPELRVHGIITGSNWTANTIPDNAKLTYIVRAPTKDDLVELADRVIGCFKGAALSTQTTVKIKMEPAYYDLRQNAALAREFSANAISRYNMTINGIGSTASTDFGNVSYEIPCLHPLYAIPTIPNGGNHTRLFADAAATPKAHAATITVAKGLALTGFRVIFDSQFFKEVREAFQADKKGRGV